MTDYKLQIEAAEMAAKDRIAKYDFSRAKVLFMVPSSWDKWHQMNVSHFIYQQSKKPYFLDFVPMASRSVELGRNRMALDALNKNPDWTHIMFIDWDTWPMQETIGNACERLMALDKDVAAGMYPVWLDNLPFWTCVTEEKGEAPDASKIIDGTAIITHDTSFKTGHLVVDTFPTIEPMKVCRVGMGFALVKRKVLEGIEFPYMKQLYRPDGSILCTEDYYFCDKATRAGFEIWLDPLITCSHSQRRDTTQDIFIVMKLMMEKFAMMKKEDEEQIDKEREEIRYVLNKMGMWDEFKKTFVELRKQSVNAEPQNTSA